MCKIHFIDLLDKIQYGASYRYSWPLAMLLTACLALPAPTFAAGIGDPVPSCTATDIDYSITNLAPSNFCWSPWGGDITVSFDVSIWNPNTRYNFAIGFTAAGDPTLQDITCLDTGINLDSAGCDDYNSSGTAASPVITRATLDVSCNVKGDFSNNPSADVDLYLNYETVTGGSNAEVTAQQCLLKEGITFPYLPAGLDMQKTVINENGGTALPGDWTLSANLGYGSYILSGNGYNTSNNNILAGDYILSESGPSGYTLQDISCTGATFDAATSTLSLMSGDSANCIFTNSDGSGSTPTGVDLALIKTVTDMSPSIGDVIVFTLLVSNAGPEDAVDVSATDVLPAGLSYVSGSITGGNITSANDPAGSGLQWTITSLPAGSSTALTYQATVLAP